MTKKVKTASTKKDVIDMKKVSIGLGLTAAAVTAAGAYFLYGTKNAQQNRKKVKGWVLKAKGEVLESLEKAKAITEDEFHELVATASKAYGTVKSATKGEIKEFKAEMTQHWKELEKNKAIKKIVAPVVKKSVPKVAKKVVAKKSAK